jgi:hypothetical protein
VGELLPSSRSADDVDARGADRRWMHITYGDGGAIDAVVDGIA